MAIPLLQTNLHHHPESCIPFRESFYPVHEYAHNVCREQMCLYIIRGQRRSNNVLNPNERVTPRKFLGL